MTNEEIYRKELGGIVLFSLDDLANRVDSIQDATRKDEREKVIKEIEKAIDPSRLTKNGEHFPHNVLIKLLNSLKQC